MLYIFFAGFVLHHGVQLVLGMYQGGNPGALVKTGIHEQYTLAEMFSSRRQFQILSTGHIPILSTQLTVSHHLLAPKG